MKANNFEIRLTAVAKGHADLYMPELSKAAISWTDNDSEVEDEEETFLIPDNDSDTDSDDNGQDDGEDDDDEDDDDSDDQGQLTIDIKMNALAFREYRNMRDSNIDYSIVATIIYKDDTGTPVYHHQYECWDGMFLTQVDGQKDHEDHLVLTLSGDYQDCIQFAVFQDPAASQVTH